MCFTSSSCGLSLKKQKFHTYLGQLLGICQIVNSNSQEDIQERIFWGAKKKIFTQQIQQTVPLLLPPPFFPYLQSPVYYGLTPCTTVLSSFLTHPLLLGASSAAQQVLDTYLSLAQHTSLVRIHTGAEQGGFTTLELQLVWDHRVVLETQQPLFFHSRKPTPTLLPIHTQRISPSIFPSCLKGQPVEHLEIGHLKANICIIYTQSYIKVFGTMKKLSLGHCCITYWWEETIMTYHTEVNMTIRLPRTSSILNAAASRRAQLQKSLLAGHPARGNELCREMGR